MTRIATMLSTALLTWLIAFPAGAEVGRWTANGPTGGDIVRIVLDPNAPNTMYAGACSGGLFKSTDAGATWQRVSSLTGATRGCVNAIAVDPHDSNILYASRFADGIFKSTDGGTNWFPVNTGLSTNLELAVTAIAIDPVDADTVYVANNVGVFKSTDGGASWTNSSSGLGSGPVWIATMHPSKPTTLFALQDRAGVFKSTNGGATWNAVNVGFADLFIFSLALDPVDPDTVYAASARSGLYKSVDGGATWTSANGNLPYQSVGAIAIDPSSASTLYVAARSNISATAAESIFKSADGGATWTAAAAGPSDISISHIVVQPATPAVVYAATAWGVFRSVDAGTTWNPSNAGLVATLVSSIAMDPQMPTTLYASTGGQGIFKTTDGGATWAQKASGLPHFLGHVFVNRLAVDPAAPSTVFASVASGALFRSTDGGESWIDTNSGIVNPFVFAFDPGTPGVMYAGTGDGVFKSLDSGAHWTEISNGLVERDARAVNALVVDPAATSTIYAGTWSGIYKSTDGGGVWTNVGSASAYVASLALDRAAPPALYASVYGEGILRSTDGGVTWSPANAGLPDLYVSAIATSAASPGAVYCATDSGVFKTTDGANWTAMNTGLAGFPRIVTLAVDGRAPAKIYAATYLGVYAFEEPTSETTLPGTDVTVEPIDPVTNTTPVTITFSNVTAAGSTTVTTSGTGAPPPTGFRLGNPPVYYEISTTAGWNGTIEICINYSGVQFGREANLQLFHRENGVWVDVTTSLDTTANVICGVVSSLSPFGVFEAVPPPAIAVSVTPSVLWPANHALVEVHVEIQTSDPSALPVSIQLVSIVSGDDPATKGAGSTSSDIADAELGTDDRVFRVRAERSGRAGDRVYTVTYRATNSAGASATAVARITVPHDRRK